MSKMKSAIDEWSGLPGLAKVFAVGLGALLGLGYLLLLALKVGVAAGAVFLVAKLFGVL